MIYKPFQNLQLSALGMGAMRLPVIDGNDNTVNEPAVFEMVDRAMEQGVNYYDTAWGYHGGNSELVMGRALHRYPRDRFCLADKFPGYDLSNMDKVEEIFNRQLEKCQVDFFDFYLFHNVCEMNIDAYLDPAHGIYDYLKQQKENGRIKHLGFSAHGSVETMKRFLDAYGKDMEFCQIQLNYLDWTLQDAKAKVDLLHSWNIPIWVMEPLRGGRLANLPEAQMTQLTALRPEETAPGWAFRFLQAVPGVTVILSGMSNLAQMEGNLETFSKDAPLNAAEMEKLLSFASELMGNKTVPCTACRYCTNYCPQALDIPTLLRLYNDHSFSGGGFLAPMALASMSKEKWPSACIGCRSCERVCPQQIKISETMDAFAKMLQ